MKDFFFRKNTARYRAGGPYYKFKIMQKKDTDSQKIILNEVISNIYKKDRKKGN